MRIAFLLLLALLSASLFAVFPLLNIRFFVTYVPAPSLVVPGPTTLSRVSIVSCPFVPVGAGVGMMWGGDACVALVLLLCTLFPSSQGDMAKYLPVKAGVGMRRGGDALCCASPSSYSPEPTPLARATQASPLHPTPPPLSRVGIVSCPFGSPFLPVRAGA